MVRAYDTSDLEQVMEIWLQTNKEAHDFIPKSYWEGNYEMVKELMASASKCGIELFVFEEAGQITGFIGIDQGFIEGLFVKKNNQKQGIGKCLMQQAKKSYKNLSLKVYAKNENAIAFYKNQGFQIVSQGNDENTGEKEFLMTFTC